MSARPRGEITEPLDPEIGPLVEALREDDHIVTQGSCSGHAKEAAYVELAVQGTDGLRAFVERVNRVDRAVRKEAWFDIKLNWSEEVATACAFHVFPDWIMLSWRISGVEPGEPPSAELLSKIARKYRAARARSGGRNRPPL